MALTDIKIKAAKVPEGKSQVKLTDGKGLFLLVKNNGSKYWRMNYRFYGKQKTLALGVYPAVTLKKARTLCEAARQSIVDGIDPSEAKRASKHDIEDCFQAIAREWFNKFSPNWSPAYQHKVIRGLERDIFPWLGNHPINAITAPQLLQTARRIESRGALETAHKIMQTCGQVFRYAIATGKAERDPCQDLRGALPPVKTKHHASITEPKEIAKLLRVMDDYQGRFVTKCALRFAPLVFVRPGELRQAEWEEINFEESEWRIPAHKMKAREKHIVPLSTQAIAILEELQPLTGSGKFIFPATTTTKRPMSEGTINQALRRLGYGKEEMTGHGFRSMASTLLNEQGWHRDAIERQLAHAERNNVRAAYNYAEHLTERIKMMQAWADYLEGLKTGANVVAFKKKA